MIFVSSINGQTIEWAKAFTGEQEIMVYSVAVDKNDDILVTGNYKGTADFDPGPGQEMKTSFSREDIFIMKLNSCGELKWVKTLGSNNGQEYGRHVTTDFDNNVYVFGTYGDKIDMDPGPGTFYLLDFWNSEMFILKLDKDGDFVWASGITQSVTQSPNSIRVDSEQNVIITGSYRGTTDFDPGRGQVLLTSTRNDVNGFIAKYDINGALLWAKRIGSSAGTDRGRSVVINEHNEIFVIGEFVSSVDFNEGGRPYKMVSENFRDIFICKYSPNGEIIWGNNFGGRTPRADQTMVIDEDENIYYVANFDLPISVKEGDSRFVFEPGLRGDSYWAILNSDGDLQSAFQLTGDSWESLTGIEMGNNENLYLYGTFVDSCILNFKDTTVFRSFTGSNENLVVHCDTSGNILWLVGQGGTGPSWNLSAKVNSKDRLICGGAFEASDMNFDFSSEYWKFSSTGDRDGHVCKFGPPNYIMQAVEACDSFTWVNGKTYYESIDTAQIKFNSSEGCDSVVALRLKISYSKTEVVERTACEFYLNGSDTLRESKKYKFEFKSTFGCDSNIILDLKIGRSSIDTILMDTCRPFTWHGQYIMSSGYYLYDTLNHLDCDSLVVLTVSFHEPIRSTETFNICTGDTLIVFGEVVTTPRSIQKTFISQNDCDSIHTINVLVDDVYRGQKTVSLCERDSVFVIDRWFYSEGTHEVVKLNPSDCDSIIDVVITELGIVQSFDSLRLCEGDTIQVFDTLITTRADVARQFNGSNGCDSVSNVFVSIENLGISSIDTSICVNDSVQIFGSWFHSSGSYQIRVTTSGLCDSLYDINISELLSPVTNDTIRLCEGDTLNIFGQIVTSTSDISQQFTAYNGCDSNSNVHASFGSRYSEDSSFQLCPDDSLRLNGLWIYSDTSFSISFQSAQGCDSIVNHDIKFLSAPEPPTFELDCESESISASIDAGPEWRVSWDNGDTSNSTTYQSGGRKEIVLTSQNGCLLTYSETVEDIPDISSLGLQGDTILSPGSILRLQLALDQSEWRVLWLPSDVMDCDSCFNVTINASSITEIIILLSHNSGCDLEHRFKIQFDDSIYIPNVFTPNGDNINDVFTAYFTEIFSILSCEIYNRWGELVYSSRNDNNFGWDGTFNGENAPSAVYTYKLEFENARAEREILAGDLTLLR